MAGRGGSAPIGAGEIEGALSRIESSLEIEMRSLLTQGLSRLSVPHSELVALTDACVTACSNSFDQMRAMLLTGEGPEPNPAHSPTLIEDAISEFDLAAQELLHMRFGLGYSFEKIGEVTGADPDSSRAQVSAAVETLRRHPNIRESLGF